MLPWKSIISISKNRSRAIYLQVADAIIEEILKDRIPKGYKMPGGRVLSDALSLNRKTVTQAYDELLAQGWLEIIPSKGTFVKDNLPLMNYQKLEENPVKKNSDLINGLNILPFDENREYSKPQHVIDDGSPDYRFAPVDALYKSARYFTKGRIGKSILLNSSSYGELTLRETLQTYLSDTRALNGSIENIIITRGSQMALYLLFNVLLNKNDNVVVGNLNYYSANTIVKQVGGNLICVPVNNQGLDINAIEDICKKKPIKAVYITPHHHFPTTVIMPVNRRMQLLDLSMKYNFAIIEDDYDYDYHYSGSPILPLASLDKSGNVIYIGSFSKILVPSIRIGYMYAHSKIIQETAKLRRIIDKQGDPIIERALAHLLQENEIQRHLKKAVNAYKKRRDLFCNILKYEFSGHVNFDIPDGGMAIWAKFNAQLMIPELVRKAKKHNLYLNIDSQIIPSSCRLGFASTNEDEIIKNLDLLKKTLSS